MVEGAGYRHVLSHSLLNASSCVTVQSSMAHDAGLSSAYFILQAALITPNCCSETSDDCTFCSNKSAQDKKKFLNGKKNCLPAKEPLKHNSLLSFIISPSTRSVHLYFHSFNKGTISFYSVLLIGLMAIMSKENKKEVELTC